MCRLKFSTSANEPTAYQITGTWDMAIASNRQQRGTGAWRGEMSGLNCHTVLRPIDAALDEM